MMRLADVWRMKSVHKPCSTPACRTSAATCSVSSCKPCADVRTLSCLTIRARFQRRHRGKRLALEEFEKCAAGGRDVVDILVEAELVDSRDGIAPAGDAERFRFGDRMGERFRALGKRRVLEDAHRPIPDDRARLLERACERLCGLWADVEDHLVAR